MHSARRSQSQKPFLEPEKFVTQRQTKEKIPTLKTEGGGTREVAMSQTVVPMIHVADVRATVEWYASIGFTLVRQNEEDGEINWAKLTFGNSEVMFDAGGKPSTGQRREVDLYILTENVDDLYQCLKDRVQVVEEPHDTFYGMRELIIRDINRFWITFGQPIQM